MSFGSKSRRSSLASKGFICKADEVCLDFSGGFIVDPVDGLISRIGDLLRVFGNFNLWYELSVLALDGGKLVDASERRTVLEVIGLVPTPQESMAAPASSDRGADIRPDRWKHRWKRQESRRRRAFCAPLWRGKQDLPLVQADSIFLNVFPILCIPGIRGWHWGTPDFKVS